MNFGSVLRMCASRSFSSQAGAKDHVEAFLLRLADEFRHVVLAAEVVQARRGFVRVPEYVGGDGVQAHRLGHLQTRTPVFAGNTCVMHVAGNDAEWLAIQQELAVLDGKRVRCGRWGSHCVACKQHAEA
jgi:hypothetical protein